MLTLLASGFRYARRLTKGFVLGALAASTLIGAGALAQSLDTTVEDLVDDLVEEELVGSVEEDVESGVEQAVEDAVEQAVESGVTQAVEQQVESGVAQGVEQQLESTVEQQVESQVGEALEQTLDGVLDESLGQDLEGALEEIPGALEETLEGVVEDTPGALEETVGTATGLVEDSASTAAGALTPLVGATPGGAPRFFPAVDPNGWTIERNVWVVLLPVEYVGRVESWGFTVREQRPLESLGLRLIKVDAPADRDMADAALQLALDAPGTVVDFNHVYRSGAAGEGGGKAAAAAATQPAPGTAALSIGIIDSSVAVDHEALRRASITQRDFVSFAHARPTRHGTAVASILVGDSPVLRGRLAGARLYAASVFFEGDAGDQLATSGSLVEALAWMAGEGVDVVNMSLSGPPNRLLEAAIARIVAGGAVVVAAVGNNGPSGDPLYPAAYPAVVGVTAVDSANRIYRYANRGRQVTFAAPGVDIKVAHSDGGYRAQTGTSLAAPYAAAIIARSLVGARTPDNVIATLKAAALDLGDKGFDDVFGFGLIAAGD